MKKKGIYKTFKLSVRCGLNTMIYDKPILDSFKQNQMMTHYQTINQIIEH